MFIFTTFDYQPFQSFHEYIESDDKAKCTVVYHFMFAWFSIVVALSLLCALLLMYSFILLSSL